MKTYPYPRLLGFCLLYQGSHTQWSIAHESRIVSGKIYHACSKTLNRLLVIVSKILLKIERIDIGRQFQGSVSFPSLNTGTTLACFDLEGRWSYWIETFNKVVNGLAIMSREHTNIWLWQGYNPCALLERVPTLFQAHFQKKELIGSNKKE